MSLSDRKERAAPRVARPMNHRSARRRAERYLIGVPPRVCFPHKLGEGLREWFERRDAPLEPFLSQRAAPLPSIGPNVDDEVDAEATNDLDAEAFLEASPVVPNQVEPKPSNHPVKPVLHLP